MTTMTIAKAINEGLRATLNNNPRALLMGEDIGPLGGVYRVTDGLIAEFGADRVVEALRMAEIEKPGHARKRTRIAT